MSTTVDNRVVEMRFDNKQFESGVQTSLGTLEKLRQSLRLTDSAKGLEDVSNAAKKFDVSGMSNGLETIKAKFSALQVVSMTALSNITNSAINAGKKLVSAFTIDPIKTGFQEYETQINAVQTILSNTRSKGTTLTDVNAALDELNTYADKTIYNFTEMTRNIGTFTAAGVDLDTSVSAIKGIANLAAVSGSNSQQASTAMYQLSQALSSGTVKLQDWNSVVNAGMGGQVFQDALKETARVHGIAIDKMIKDEGSFRETLSKGWLSSEILTETLSKFTGDLTEQQIISMGYTKEQAKEILALGEDANNAATKVKTFTQLMDTLKEAAQSGWTQSWEIIVGDFEEAKALYTEVSDTLGALIGDSANARNELLQGWKDLGGRTDVIDAIKNAFNGVLNIVKPIKEAFRDLFPATTSEQLYNITHAVKELSEKFLAFSKGQGDNIKRTFRGIFAVFKIGVTFVKSLASGVSKLLGHFTGLSGGILGVTASIGDWLYSFSEAINKTNIFGKIIDALVTLLGAGIDKVKNFGSALKDAFTNSDFGKMLLTASESVQSFLENLGNGKANFSWLDTLFNILSKISNALKTVGVKIAEFATKIGKSFESMFRNGDFNTALDLLNGGIFSGILVNIRKFFKDLNDSKKEGGGLKNSIKEILDGVKGSLEAWQKSLKADALKKIATAIAILAGSLFLIALIEPERLTTSLGAITVCFGDLLGSYALFDKIDGKGKNATKGITTMIGMSVAVLILASALKKIGDLDIDQIRSSLSGIGGITAILIVAAKLMSKEEGTITKFGGQMILMSIAVGTMALVAKLLSSFSWGELAKAGAGLVGIVAILVSAAKIMNNESSAITKFGAQMILMSIAVGAMALVAKLLSSFSWGELAKSGVGLLGIIAMLVGASAIMSKIDPAKFAGQMMAMSIAVGAMALVAKLLSSFSWGELAKAGVGLLGIVAMLVASSVIMSKCNPTKFAGQMIAMSIAIGILAGTMKLIATMSVGEIAKSLITIAVAITILGVAGLLLEPVIPAMLGIAAAIALMGTGCLSVGAGILALAAGLTMLAGMTTAAATAIVASISIIIVGLLELIPSIIGALTDAVVAICQVFIQSIPAIGEAVKALVLTIVDAIVKCAPAIVEGALFLLSSFIQSLADHLPEIVQAGYDIILAFLGGIRDNIGKIVNIASDIIINFLDAMGEKIPEIAQAGIDFIFNLIEGMAQGMEENAERAREVMTELCESMLNAALAFFGIHSPSTVFADIGGNLVQGLINGIGSLDSNAVTTIKTLASNLVNEISAKSSDFTEKGILFMSNLKTGISNKISEVKASSKQVVTNAIGAISSMANRFRTKGIELISNLKLGIINKISDVKSAAGKVVSGALDKLREKISSFKSIGSDMIKGLKEGIKSAASSVVEAAKGVCSSAIEGAKNLLKINSPSKVFIKIGKGIPEGLAVGIDRLGGMVKSSVASMANIAINETKNAMSNVADYISSDIDTQPTIRPVVDLSDINITHDRISIGADIDTRFMSGSVESISQLMRDTQDAINASNTEVINAVNGLRDDLNNLYSSDGTEIGLYVDGRKLASSIAKPMNYQLNLIAKRGG